MTWDTARAIRNPWRDKTSAEYLVDEIIEMITKDGVTERTFEKYGDQDLSALVEVRKRRYSKHFTSKEYFFSQAVYLMAEAHRDELTKLIKNWLECELLPKLAGADEGKPS